MGWVLTNGPGLSNDISKNVFDTDSTGDEWPLPFGQELELVLGVESRTLKKSHFESKENEVL